MEWMLALNFLQGDFELLILLHHFLSGKITDVHYYGQILCTAGIEPSTSCILGKNSELHP